MKIEMVPIEAIKEYERNPRVNDAAVSPVAESIRAFGFKVPVIIDAQNVLVAGHTRVKAARQLAMTEVPAIRADDLTPEQIQAFRIAENKLHELSAWDLELLPGELAELQALDVDLSLLGFSKDELSALFDAGVKPGLTDSDEIPAPPDEAITQPGDLWILGEHRLLCGDSGLALDVDRLLDGAPVHLACCDPPYGVMVEPRSANAIAAGNSSFPHAASRTNHQAFDVARQGRKKPTSSKLRPKDRPLVNDHLSDAEFDRRLHDWFKQIGRVLMPGRAFYLWAGWTNLRNYPAALTNANLFWHQLLVWVKNAPVLCRKDYMLGYEVCFYGWKSGAAHQWFGPNNARDVWEVAKVPQQKMVHLTEKPVELAIRAIQYSSRVGENVLDLFGGSGSTLIAAEQTGRRAFLMELDPLYVDVVVARWEKFTGRKAERISDRSNAPQSREALVEGK